MRKTAVVLTAALMLATGCSGGADDPDDGDQARRSSGGSDRRVTERADDGTRTGDWPKASFASALEPFDDCDAFLEDRQDAALDDVGPYGLTTGLDQGMVAREGIPMPTAAGGEDLALADEEAAAPPTTIAVTTMPSKSSNESDGDSSQTNVQEAGVDEPDVVKHDGSTLFSVADGQLRVVDVSGPTPTLLTTQSLPAESGNAQLLLAGDHLLVIESGWLGMVPFADEAVARSIELASGAGTTELTILDVSDPADPAVVQRLSVDGSLLGARMVDGKARLVTSAGPTELGFVYPQTAAAEDEAEAANRRIIENTTVEDWLPTYRVISDDEAISSAPLVTCANVSHPGVPSGNGSISVVSVDVEAGAIDPADTVSVVADGQTIYASPTTLYVATYEMPSSDVIDDPQQAEPEDFASSIHAFDITGDGPAEYVGSGEVQGRLLNQFAMSEHEGVLRVATTVGPPWGDGGSESWVTTLELDGADLVQLGRVGDMGEGEQIYAVRFIDDQGYVVTFRQTDPLYTLDLSDPTKPRVAGELKIPGYSSYLHPIGDGRLIGIGQDATGEGRTTGTKVSLFDVSNPASPSEVSTWTLPGSNSSAESDHHAFLWWPDEDLLVAPLSSYGYDPVTGLSTDGFEGAVGLTVTAGGITERGRIAHVGSSVPPNWYCPPDVMCAMPSIEQCPPESDCASVPTTVVDGGVCDPSAGCDPVPMPTPVPAPTEVPISRVLVVDGSLLSISSAGIERSAMADLSELAWVPWS